MKCVRCSRVATFDSPKHYCDLHLNVWFNGGFRALNNEDTIKQCIKDLKRTWREYGKPKDWKNMLKILEDRL